MLNNKMAASLKVLFSMKKYIKINKKSIAVLDK